MWHKPKYFKVRHVVAVAALFAFLVSGSVQASSTGADLARQNKCLACHQVDARRVGPPFTAVAERFADQPGAQAYLAGVIQRGGRGQWGAIPMPAQPHVNAAQAGALAQWILSLAAVEETPNHALIK